MIMMTEKMKAVYIVLMTINALYGTLIGGDPDTCTVPVVDNVGDADVIIGGLFNIHERGLSGVECGSRINTDALQRLEAFLFAIDSLNNWHFIPPVKFGALAYDTCGQNYNAVKRTLEFLAHRGVSSDTECSSGPLFLGVVGPLFSDTTEDVASLLTSSKLNQISYGARGLSLSDKKKYPYFSRVVPNIRHLAEATLDIVKELGWTAVNIISADDTDATDMKEELLRMSGVKAICITALLEISNDETEFPDIISSLLPSMTSGVRGVILLTLPETTTRLVHYLELGAEIYPDLHSVQFIHGLSYNHNTGPYRSSLLAGSIYAEEYQSVIPGYQEYFLNLDPITHKVNPWFQQYWEQENNCTLNKTCSYEHKLAHAQSYSQARYVSQTVAAVLAFGHGLKSTVAAVCGHDSGLCPMLPEILPEQFTEFIRKVTFVNMDDRLVSFDENGDLLNPIYAVKNIQRRASNYYVNQTALWTPVTGLRMTSSPQMYNRSGHALTSYPLSACHWDCICLNELSDDIYGRQDGETIDILLVGVFDIHDQGIDGTECDYTGVNEASVQAMESMYFAINQINSNPNILPDINIGAVVFDSCRSASRVLRQMNMLLNGDIKVKGRMGKTLVPRAVIGGANSHVTMALAEVLKLHRIPLISYGTTSPELSNADKYPYFMRTVSTNDAQALAIVDVLKTFNWDYVTVFYSDSPYGESAFTEFMKIAQSENICIASQVKLEDYIVADKQAMVNLARFYIQEGFPESRVVVLFTSDSDARALLSAYKSQLNGDIGQVVWIGTDLWGSRSKVIDGLETVAMGAITVGFYSQEIPRFMNHMLGRNPKHNIQNPWYVEYWQHYFKCYINGNFKSMYPNECDSSQTFANDKLRMTDSVPYVIDSVYTTAIGLHHLVWENCGNASGTVCILANKDMHSLFSYMKNVEFYNGITNLNISYDVLGNGAPKYNIFNFIYDGHTQEYNYHTIGTWIEGKLNIEDRNAMAYQDIYGVQTPANDVASSCEGCLCSGQSVSDLEYQLKYARLTLIGYFPVHGMGLNNSPCSRFRSVEGFLQFMSFKYAIERVNMDASILGNVTLGFMAFDSCSDPGNAELAFRSWQAGLRFFTQRTQVPVITYTHAFIGGYDDAVTKVLNPIDQSHVHISSGTRSDDLSSDEDYKFFLRTVSPYSTEFRAISDVLFAMRWTYISMLYQDDTAEYHKDIKLFLEEKGICIAMDINLSLYDELRGYEMVVNDLYSAKGAIGVIALLEPRKMRLLLSSANTVGTTGKLIWIGTELWGNDPTVYDSMVDAIKGSVIVVPEVAEDPYFNSYMHSKSPETDPDNPWIAEFWQELFKCDLSYPGQHGKICSGRESLSGRRFAHHPVITNTIQAVYSYAYGITKLFEDKCGEVVIPPCPAVVDSTKNAALAHYYIRTAKIPGPDGQFRQPYNDNGDGVGRFKVLNFHDRKYDNMTGFIRVGEWIGDKLYINTSLIHMYTTTGEVVHAKSECPGTCNCSRPSLQSKLDTDNVPVRFVAHATVWGIIVITIIIIGIIFTLIIFLLFVFKSDHHVVVAATLSTSTIILIGVFLMYILNFAFMTSPTIATCGCRRVGLGLSYALIFSCLLVKAIRINRVHNIASLSGQPSCVSGLSQATVALLCISVEVVLAAEWLVLKPPEVTWYYVNLNPDGFYPLYDVQWRCVHSDITLVISMVYVYLLMVLTCILSLRAHSATEFYREARYIILTTCSSATIIVCWAAILIKGPENMKTPAVCVGITLNASLVLGLMFLPKILQLTDNRQKRSNNSIAQADTTYGVSDRRKDKKKMAVKRVTNEHALAVVSGKYLSRDLS